MNMKRIKNNKLTLHISFYRDNLEVVVQTCEVYEDDNQIVTLSLGYSLSLFYDETVPFRWTDISETNIGNIFAFYHRFNPLQSRHLRYKFA